MLDKLLKFISRVLLSLVGFFIIFDIFSFAPNWIVPSMNDLWIRPLELLLGILLATFDFLVPERFLVGLGFVVSIILTILSGVVFERLKIERSFRDIIVFYLLIPPIVLLVLVGLNPMFF